jgi:PKD repeat protein
LYCDTPPVANPNFGCPSAVNSCTIDSQFDQTLNYLDYSNDNCKNIFTNGQKQRMQATLISLRNDIWQQWNLDSTGCDSGFVNSNCKVIADFVTLNTNLCIGNSITFYNKSQNNPTSYQWYFQGGTPSTSILANPTVTYSTLGMFQVKLVTSNAYGNDSLILNNYVSVTTPPIGQSLPYFEGFESVTFPTNGITIDNPDGGITWQRDTIATQYAGVASAKINNLININYGQSDALILPRFNFTTFTGIPYLNFKWAYAKSDVNYSDELIVLASKDCGVNWTQVFYRTGASMATGTTQTTPYIPSVSTVWKIANINLTTYATFSNVLIKIVNVTDGGNNLYIDNINLGSLITGINEVQNSSVDLSVFPNPNNGSFNLQYTLTENTTISINIIDILGKEVYTINNLKQPIGTHTQQMDIDLQSGIYTIMFKTGDLMTTKKIIITK